MSCYMICDLNRQKVKTQPWERALFRSSGNLPLKGCHTVSFTEDLFVPLITVLAGKFIAALINGKNNTELASIINFKDVHLAVQQQYITVIKNLMASEKFAQETPEDIHDGTCYTF